MADTKLSDLTSGTAAATDIIYAVKDPSGTPLDRKIALSSVKDLIVGAGSVSVASGKTLTASNTLTLAGTDATTMTFPSTSTTLAGLGIANSFTTAQTITPLTDAAALTVRRNSGSQSSNIFQVQTEANGALASFDKDGKLTAPKIDLYGATSGTVTLQPAAAAGTYSLTLPTNDGDAGQFLKTDGSGVLSWDTVSASPGGSNTQVQYNSSGSFAGASGITTDGTDLSLGSSSTLKFSTDLILGRKAAANLRLGAADAASPVAQTISTQNVVAGTTNTAGTNLTIAGSQGTGTGVGGNINFQLAPAGSSGTAQNALTTVASLAPAGTGGALTLTGGTVTASSPVLDMTQTWNASGTTFTGLKLNVTDTASASGSLLMDLQVGGTSRLKVSKSGNCLINSNVAVSDWIDIQYNGTSYFRINNGSSTFGGTVAGLSSNWNGTVIANQIQLDYNNGGVWLSRRASANLRFGQADAAAPVAQTLSVQSVVAGTSNTAGANLTITGSQGTGTGAGGSIIFQVAPAGSSGTAQNALSEALRINSAGLISFAGTTSSFPALKRSSAILQVRLADDSGYTTIDAEHRLQGTAPATAGAAGTAGDIRYDADYIYICTGASTWKRVAIATW